VGITTVGLVLPSIYPDIDLKGRFMSYDKLNHEISEYKLSLFNPSRYIMPQYAPLYAGGKVLVFTAFADTAVYLYDALNAWAKDELGIHTALVTGGAVENRTTFGRNEFNHILTNFSPIAKKRGLMTDMPQQGEIDLLIATDCISEGQNLQDCDYLVNYDIHWNPVRVIQRFGRIDRIGSLNHTVQLVNFWPTRDLDKYIMLKTRVEARTALVDIAATLDDNLLQPDDIEDLIKEELRYRDKQLLRLRDEVLDLEDFSESVSLNEFTLDDFRIELSKYIQSNRKALQDAALGLYAVVPVDPAYQVIAPGVIFCMRQKGDAPENETVNLLQPYFLVYVRDEREVDLNDVYGTSGRAYKVHGLIEILSHYKFTITENTPIEEEVALDPELLGKVFENLLAAYNPETGITARKQTARSTPRARSSTIWWTSP
jgi:Helicase conserved C-terminal domain